MPRAKSAANPLPKTPKKRKRVYRVEFDAIETSTEFGDFEGDRNMIRYLKSNAKGMNDHWLDIKNLKIRRVKA